MGYSAYGIVRPIYVTKSDSLSSISNTFLPFSKRLNWLNREDTYAAMSRCKDKCMFTLNAIVVFFNCALFNVNALQCINQ